jgi:uncharacterized protein YfkK (UPF0435 family)
MANMSYCRFENTYNDLNDCYEAMNEHEDLSESEMKHLKWMIEMCQNIVDDFGYIVEKD